MNSEIELLFRRHSSQMVSTLTRFFGSGNIDLAESVVQDSLVKALQTWPIQGMPENPAGWLMQVAKNQALDVVRREKNFQEKERDMIHWFESGDADTGGDAAFDEELRDDQLRMIFTCCHPALPSTSQVALTLKTLCGLDVDEIARAFLTSEETVAQRLVRAKQKIRDEKIPYEVPPPEKIGGRLETVLSVLYLLFNEGYSAHKGSELVRFDLCDESIRLGRLLARHPVSAKEGAVHALLALLLFQASRLRARADESGNVLLLAEQDRALWNYDLIREALAELEQAMTGETLSEYHLQAGIAATHALAKTYEETDWAQIVEFYDRLLEVNLSPVLGLNRAVAVAMDRGPAEGLRALDLLKSHPNLASYYLLPATYGELYRRLGDFESAGKAYERALELVGNDPERRYLIKKLKEIKG